LRYEYFLLHTGYINTVVYDNRPCMDYPLDRRQRRTFFSPLHQGIVACGQKNIKKSSRALSLAAPIILLLALIAWTLLLWMGWTFIFAGAQDSIIDIHGLGPISWTSRIYYTAYTIFTLGLGDYIPREGFWQIATALATGIFITLMVSRALWILNAVNKKRSFAKDVHALGKRSEEVLKNGWNGKDFHDLDPALGSLLTLA